MSRSPKKPIWNRRKGEESSEDYEDLEADELLDDDARKQEMIARIQHRLGVSREKARNIIKNSELL